MKAKVIIKLKIPDDIEPVGEWTVDECIYSYIEHWLEEGYYTNDYSVELPAGIKYKGFEIKYQKEQK